MEKIKLNVKKSDGHYIVCADESVCDRYCCGIYGSGATLQLAIDDLREACKLMTDPDGKPLPDFDFDVID